MAPRMAFQVNGIEKSGFAKPGTAKPETGPRPKAGLRAYGKPYDGQKKSPRYGGLLRVGNAGERSAGLPLRITRRDTA